MESAEAYLLGYLNGKGLPLAISAFKLANSLHAKQSRKNGEPYFSHPVAVCSILINQKIFDEIILAAALLHDVIEEKLITFDELVKLTNLEIATLTMKVTKIKDDQGNCDPNKYFLGMKDDIRAILIKVADRMDNLKNIVQVFTKEKIKEYYHETINYILPLAELARKNHDFDFVDYSEAFNFLSYCLNTQLVIIESAMFLKGTNLE